MAEIPQKEFIDGYEIPRYPFFTDGIIYKDDVETTEILTELFSWTDGDGNMKTLHHHLNMIGMPNMAITFLRSMKLRDRLAQFMGPLIEIAKPTYNNELDGDLVNVFNAYERENDGKFFQVINELSALEENFEKVVRDQGDISELSSPGEVAFIDIFNVFKTNVYPEVKKESNRAILSLTNPTPELLQRLQLAGFDISAFMDFLKEKITAPAEEISPDPILERERLIPMMRAIINTMRIRITLDHLLQDYPDGVKNAMKKRLLIPTTDVLKSPSDVYSIKELCDIMMEESERGIHYIYEANVVPPYDNILKCLS